MWPILVVIYGLSSVLIVSDLYNNCFLFLEHFLLYDHSSTVIFNLPFPWFHFNFFFLILVMLSRLSHPPPVFPVPECLSNLDLPPRNDWMLKHDLYLNYLLKYILTLLLASQTQNFQKWRLHCFKPILRFVPCLE